MPRPLPSVTGWVVIHRLGLGILEGKRFGAQGKRT